MLNIEERKRVTGILAYARSKGIRSAVIDDAVTQLVELGASMEDAKAKIDAVVASLQAESSGESGDSGESGGESGGESSSDAVTERKRSKEILAIARRAGVGMETAENWISGGLSLADASRRAVDLMASRQSAGPSPVAGISTHITGGVSDVEKLARAAEEALLHRADPRKFQLSQGNEIRGMSLVELGKEYLRRQGRSHAHMGRIDVAASMQQRSGTHSTSDFPAVLSGVASKLLRAAYEEQGQGWRDLVNETQLPDFKQAERVQISEAPPLQLVPEGAEIKMGTFGESKEVYKLLSYGVIVSLSRQAIINDDLNAFVRGIRSFGGSAARLESDLVIAQITANGNMSDGNALFSTAHANLLTGADASPPSSVALGAAMAKLGLQTGLKGAVLNLEPFAILCPLTQRVTWEKILGHVDYSDPMKTATRTMQGLRIIHDARLDSHNPLIWYLCASPSQVDLIEVGYLEGYRQPRVTTDEQFQFQGTQVKLEHDFATKALDWRGMVRNDGTTPSEE